MLFLTSQGKTDRMNKNTSDMWPANLTDDTVTLDNITPTTPPITDIAQYLNDSLKIDKNTTNIKPNNLQSEFTTDQTKDTFYTNVQPQDKMTSSSQDFRITHNTPEECSDQEQIMQVTSYGIPKQMTEIPETTKKTRKGRNRP